jgi:DNA polymerase III alpha subunit
LGNCGLQAFEGALKNLAKRSIKTPVRDLAAAVCDPATIASISEGRTMGCFYIESPAMRSLLKRLGTSTFEDLTIASSVIRPGVAESGMMQEYIRRTHGMERKLPSHPLMERLLPETKGVMVFQEDVIRVAHEIAGLTPSEGDLLRRAMSGKLRSRERILEMKQRFVAGCISRGVGPEGAEELWRQTESFSGYSFCKAHSASFATLSFQVAWLKAHYPADFMAAVLSHHGGFYANSAYLSECRRLGLKIFPPDINRSEFDYIADWSRADKAGEPDSVRVGLSVIAAVRAELLKRIPEERIRNGAYRNLVDFIHRARPQQAELSILIQCGALDSLQLTRPELQWLADSEYAAALRGLPLPLDDSARLNEFRRSFGGRLRDFDEATRLRMELTHFGMLISRHPLELLPPIPNIVSAAELERYKGARVRMVGVCIARKPVLLSARIRPEGLIALQSSMADEPVNARQDDDDELSTAEDIGLAHHGWAGMQATQPHMKDETLRMMMFMSMEDLSGTFEVTLFEKVYERYAALTREGGTGSIYIISGKVEEQFGTVSLDAETLELCSEERFVVPQPSTVLT